MQHGYLRRFAPVDVLTPSELSAIHQAALEILEPELVVPRPSDQVGASARDLAHGAKRLKRAHGRSSGAATGAGRTQAAPTGVRWPQRAAGGRNGPTKARELRV